MYSGLAKESNSWKRRGIGGYRCSNFDIDPDAKPCDKMLVVRAQSGDNGAFDALVRKYRHRVMKLSMRYTRNRADAEDAVQNTFIKAYLGLNAFRGESAFYSWLHRIAINSAKTVLALRARNAGVFASTNGNADPLQEASVRCAGSEASIAEMQVQRGPLPSSHCSCDLQDMRHRPAETQHAARL